MTTASEDADRRDRPPVAPRTDAERAAVAAATHYASVHDLVTPPAGLCEARESFGTLGFLVDDLTGEYAAATGTTSEGDAAVDFVREYAGVVVPEQLRLLSTYGVALESHLQNSVVAFDGPRPVATLVRDFGGIRVDGERLADRGLSMDPYPASDPDADGEEDLRRKPYYALFRNHFAELVAAVAADRAVDEAACWGAVRAACETAFDRLLADPSVPDDRVRRDRRALYADPATHEALTAMRLRGERHEYVTSEVSNPLARE